MGKKGRRSSIQCEVEVWASMAVGFSDFQPLWLTHHEPKRRYGRVKPVSRRSSSTTGHINSTNNSNFIVSERILWLDVWSIALWQLQSKVFRVCDPGLLLMRFGTFVHYQKSPVQFNKVRQSINVSASRLLLMCLWAVISPHNNHGN